MIMLRGVSKNKDTTAKLGFEAMLWLADDYTDMVFGIIFPKCFSDRFQNHRITLI